MTGDRDVDLDSMDAFIPASMPSDLKGEMKKFLTDVGIINKDLLSGIDPTLISLAVDTITKKVQFSESGPVLRTYLNAIKNAASKDSAVQGSAAIAELFRSKLGLVLSSRLEVDSSALEAMSKDLTTTPKQLAPLPGDSFVGFIDKSIKWVGNVITLIRLAGVEVDPTVGLEFVASIVEIAKRASPEHAVLVGVEGRKRLKSSVLECMKNKGIGKMPAIVDWLRSGGDEQVQTDLLFSRYQGHASVGLGEGSGIGGKAPVKGKPLVRTNPVPTFRPSGYCRFGSELACPYGKSCIFKHADAMVGSSLSPPTMPMTLDASGAGRGKGKGKGGGLGMVKTEG
jgi:hypothetical protein